MARIYIQLPTGNDGWQEYRERCEASHQAAAGEVPYDWERMGL